MEGKTFSIAQNITKKKKTQQNFNTKQKFTQQQCDDRGNALLYIKGALRFMMNLLHDGGLEMKGYAKA